MWCVFAAWLSIYLPRIMVAQEQVKQPGGMDNNDPREQQAKLSERGRRASAAHANGFEAFPAFAAAVILAHLTGADATISAALAITFVVVRCLYPFVYLSGKGSLRTAVWVLGFLATLALFVLGAF